MNPEEDIRGPRAPVEIPVPEAFSLTPWLIAAGVLAAAALVVRWWLRRRGKLAEVSAGARALEELHALDAERNVMEAAPLADRAADAVRRFIAGRFGIAAPQRTTEEFLRSLTGGGQPELAAHRDLLHGFLSACDAAKFAGAQFDASERLRLLQAALRFVQAAALPGKEGA
jgi:hypothetical protein